MERLRIVYAMLFAILTYKETKKMQNLIDKCLQRGNSDYISCISSIKIKIYIDTEKTILLLYFLNKICFDRSITSMIDAFSQILTANGYSGTKKGVKSDTRPRVARH